MITGYNTDVRHSEVVYHIQTEDKGLANPFIESLVYVGGQILGSKRTSYRTLLSEGKGERAIIALMDHQHRTLIAAVRAGKFDRKLATLRVSGGHPLPAETEDPSDATVASLAPLESNAPLAPGAPAEPGTQPLAAAAGPTVSGDRERTLDQVILDYLTSEAQQEQLVIAVDTDKGLAPGGDTQLVLRTTSSKTGGPVAHAKVVVRMISTLSDPATLGAGETGEDGTLALTLEIPAIGRGTAALIITAASIIGKAEFKQLL